MSLFRKLFNLHSDEHRRLEDFHTEIVAHVLSTNPDLTLRWLRSLNVTELHEADEVAVSTQYALQPIEDLHTTGSRPDISIRMRNGSRVEAVFIESKVGSDEQPGQLSTYAEHLRAKKEDVKRRTLIFITRDYEPKDLSDGVVQFVPTRWADFYRFISDLDSPTDTICELLKFMKENNMSQSNQFTAIDILALTNHRHARSLMNATMFESVVGKFAKVCGATGSEAKAMSRLRRNNDYSIIAGHGTGYQIQFVLGYSFPDDQPTDSPDVGMGIHLNPKASERAAIAKAMLKFSEASKATKREWSNWNLVNDREWAGIGCSVNLQDFLAQEDHVTAIVRWFEELLEDAAAFRKQNPKLPWSVKASEGDDE